MWWRFIYKCLAAVISLESTSSVSVELRGMLYLSNLDSLRCGLSYFLDVILVFNMLLLYGWSLQSEPSRPLLSSPRTLCVVGRSWTDFNQPINFDSLVSRWLTICVIQFSVQIVVYWLTWDTYLCFQLAYIASVEYFDYFFLSRNEYVNQLITSVLFSCYSHAFLLVMSRV